MLSPFLGHYQGTSATIGLPSMLLKRENELLVLIVYFLLIVVLPPVCVGIWWSANRQVHESGVLLDTLVVSLLWAILFLNVYGDNKINMHSLPFAVLQLLH
jgi:hypothetical protein